MYYTTSCGSAEIGDYCASYVAEIAKGHGVSALTLRRQDIARDAGARSVTHDVGGPLNVVVFARAKIVRTLPVRRFVERVASQRTQQKVPPSHQVFGLALELEPVIKWSCRIRDNKPRLASR
jgi:hypothetical protein